MRRVAILAAAVVCLTGRARADEPAEPSPLEVKVALAVWGETEDPHSVPSGYRVGQLPAVAVTVTNKSPGALAGEGTLAEDGYSLGPGSRVEVTGPDGKTTVFTPTIADCAPGEKTPLAPGEARKACVLGLSQYFALPDAGSYTLTVSLKDEKGRVARSEPLGFHVIAPGPFPTGVSLTIERVPDSGLSSIKATFSNDGDRAWTVVSPQDGSEMGWVEPHYWFVVRDEGGRLAPLMGRCGNCGACYDEKSLVVLEPKKSVTFALTLPNSLDGGRHSVRLHYVMSERPAKAQVGFPDGEETRATGTLPASADKLILSHLTSNELTFEVPGPRRDAWLRGPVGDAVTKFLEALPRADEADPYKRQGEVMGAVHHLHQLVTAAVLSDDDRARVRRGLTEALAASKNRRLFISVPEAMATLEGLADESCLSAFRAGILDISKDEVAGEIHWAATGLRRVLGRKGVAELGGELEKRTGERVIPIIEGIGAYTGLPEVSAFARVPVGEGAYRSPSTDAEFADGKARFLAWWATAGGKWIAEPGDR